MSICYRKAPSDALPTAFHPQRAQILLDNNFMGAFIGAKRASHTPLRALAGYLPRPWVRHIDSHGNVFTPIRRKGHNHRQLWHVSFSGMELFVKEVAPSTFSPNQPLEQFAALSRLEQISNERISPAEAYLAHRDDAHGLNFLVVKYYPYPRLEHLPDVPGKLQSELGDFRDAAYHQLRIADIWGYNAFINEERTRIVVFDPQPLAPNMYYDFYYRRVVVD